MIKRIKNVGDAVVVEAVGELNIQSSPGFHTELVEICMQSPSHLLIDLTEVPYIDSSGIGTILEILRRTKQNGGRMSLVGISGHVLDVFKITRMDQVFSIYATQAEALGS